MRCEEFYTLIKDESSAIQFLQARQLLPASQRNHFFSFHSTNRRLLELVYLWSKGRQLLIDIIQNTGLSSATVSDKLNYIREVCTATVRGRSKMVGTPDNPVQIDEFRLNRRAEDRKENTVDQNQRNHGDRADGPWVFGLCQRQGKDCRLFVVDRRNRDTLIPIIQDNVAAGSVIHSDERSAYSCLGQLGYHHQTVKHQNNFVNPVTGVNTQRITRIWGEAKLMIEMRDVPLDPLHLLQGHLDEFCWRQAHKGEDIFEVILAHIRSHYSQ